MLKIEKLTCGYGPLNVVHKLDLIVEKGSIHALLVRMELEKLQP